MTNYEKILDQFDGEIVGEPVSIDIKTWNEPNDRLIGRLKEVKDFEGGQFETTCNQYLFETDSGLISTILGASIDKQIEPEKYIGKILMITYKGKTELKDGRSCNRFAVMDVTKVYESIQKSDSQKSLFKAKGE